MTRKSDFFGREYLENQRSTQRNSINHLQDSLDVIEEEVDGFFNYQCDTERLEDAVYTFRKIYGSIAGKDSNVLEDLHRRAKGLEDSRDLEVGLTQDAQEAKDCVDRYLEIGFSMWGKAGFDIGEIDSSELGSDPLKHFLDLWEDRPDYFFQGEESYEGNQLSEEETVAEPTMVRNFDIPEEDATEMQRDDKMRGIELEQRL